MPNFAGALKSEIRRLARKEVRATVMPLRKLVAGLRKRVAQQRKLIHELERTARRSIDKARASSSEAMEQGESQIRFSPEWVKSHRRKLKMSRRVYAKLVGVSAQSIFGWETGRSRPRRRALKSWRKVRSMGLRELKSEVGAGAKRAKRGRARPTKRGRPAGKRRAAVRRTSRRRVAKKK